MRNKEWIADILMDDGYKKLAKKVFGICKKDGGCRACEHCDCEHFSTEFRDWMNATKKEVDKNERYN